MQTVERLLTNAVKRFVGHIGDLALPTETQAQPLQMPEPSLTGITMAQRKPVMRQQSKPRKNAKPLKAPERSGFFPVVTSNVLNMICVTTVVATVLAVLLSVAKWT